MSATRARRPAEADDVAPSVPQTTPTSIGYGHSDHSFTLQSIMEMQKTLGELNASVVTLTKSVDSTKSKVEDLVNWKNRILGGAILAGALISIVSVGIAKFSDYITIKAPERPAPSVQPMSTPVSPQPAAAAPLGK